MLSCILSTSYLAPVQYYCKLFYYENIWIEKHCNYIKQTYRNRCLIGAANGVMPLSVPIEKLSGIKQLTKDIRIAEHGDWQHQHWNAIISAYNSTPFFEYYQDDFAPFFERKYMFLLDLNESLQQLILNLLGIDKDAHYTNEYIHEPKVEADDYRELIHPKKDYCTDKYFHPITYYQVFDSRFGFQANLSIIDLLFNMGPESLLILQKSHLALT